MRTLTLLLFVVAVLEGFAIWMLWTHRVPCVPATSSGLQNVLNGGSGAAADGGSTGNAVPPPPTAGPAGASPAATSASSGAGTSATTNGDLNEVPDPNCVAKTTASLLNSGGGTASPSCAPMSPPPQLRQAAKQLQGASSPATTP